MPAQFSQLLKRLPPARPRYVTPMKAQLSSELPRGDDWLFEVKLDGIRAIAIKDEKSVRLFSRRPRDLTATHPNLVAALQALPAKRLVLDGEIVALDEQGRSSFQLLQNIKSAGGKPPPIRYYIFDLLNLEGRALIELPLIERKQALQSLLQKVKEPLRFSPSLAAKPDVLWAEMNRLGLEGLIAKQRDSPYEPGQRSGAWLKIKRLNEQEVVIGGYTPPQGTRPYFGAILVGYYQGENLIYAGKVGTGFDSKRLASLYAQFQRLRITKCPFNNLPLPPGEQSMPLSEMRRCTWLRPKLVAQVKFAEWTESGLMRQPVFLGLREDKTAQEVVRESPDQR